MYTPFILPLSLISLLFFSPALAAELSTPLDPFHDISKLAQRPPEPPICCLKPLQSTEPAEEILSFEDWKTKQEQALLQQQRGEQPDGSKTRDTAPKANTRSGTTDTTPEVQYEAGNTDGSPPLEPPAPPPPHFRVPLTDRFNYANLDCSARVHYAHRSARSSASLLSSKKDRYMLSPCSIPGEDKFVVVELCEDIRIDTVQLANFEFFSGVFKDFSVSVARTYTTDPDGWTPAGTYRAKNIRGIQSFHPPTSIRDFYRFIRIDFHSHYGNEFYCPVSLLRVYGLTHLEQWKWEIWEAEYQAKNADAAVRSIAAGPSPVAEESARVVKRTSDREDPIGVLVESPAKPDGSPSETADTTASPTKTTESVPAEATFTSVLSETATTEPAIVNEVPKSTEVPSQSSHTGSSDSDVSPMSSGAENSAIPISSDPSSSSLSDLSAPSEPSPQLSSADSLVQNKSSTSIQCSDPSSSDSSPKQSMATSSLVNSSPVPTIIPHESRSVPAVAPTGESIYRTIMTRLSLLEGNSTLYLRYVEEQTRSLGDTLTRLEEDVGRLEGLGKAQTQSFQKIINELDRQRRRLEREHGELQTRVDYLTDEVVLEKRLGIAQLCLLLTVLVFMALTRGSRGEPFITQMSSGRSDSLREWGRRHLSSFSSGEWASKLKAGSPTTTPDEFVTSPAPVKKSDKVRFPTERTRDVDRTPHRSSSNLAVPLSSKGRTPAEIRAPHPRQFVAHRPRTPTSATFSVYTHAPRSSGLLGAHTSLNPPSSGQGSGRPRLRRVSSHTPAPVIHSQSVGEGTSAAPLSMKKWAKSAYLHEIRKAGPKARADTPSQTMTVSTIDTSTVQVRLDSENFEGAKQADGDSKQFWPNISPDSVVRGRERERSRDGRRDLGPRGPLSVSPLQNRSREQNGADVDRLRLGSYCQPNGGPRIVDLDTESESWVDTDVEGSEVDMEDRSP